MRHIDFCAALGAALTAHLQTLKPIRLPAGSYPAWRCFCALHETRRYDFGLPQPITHAEFAAYTALGRWQLDLRHFEQVRALDTAWLDHTAKGTASGGSSGRPVQNLSTASFDFWFSGPEHAPEAEVWDVHLGDRTCPGS